MATSPITPQRKRFSLWLGLAMLVTLLLGAIVGLYLTRTNQDIRQQAASFECGDPNQSKGNSCVKNCKAGFNKSGNCNNGVCCAPGGEDTNAPTPTKKPEDPNPPPVEGCVTNGGTCMEFPSGQTCTSVGRANITGSCNKGFCCSGGTSSGGTGGDGQGSIIGGAGSYCDSNGCDGRGECTVFRYHCDRNSNLGGGCQDAPTGVSTGRLNFTATCGAEQIDVKCGSNDGADFVSKVYSSACRTNTPTPPRDTPPVTKTPTPTPPKTPGPQCLKLEMTGFPADAKEVVPGTTQVTFTCAANKALPTDYYYKFRVFEPCGTANHTTPKELTATGATASYTIPARGAYAVQCAVCTDVPATSPPGTSAPAVMVPSCDWEPYTPSSC